LKTVQAIGVVGNGHFLLEAGKQVAGERSVKADALHAAVSDCSHRNSGERQALIRLFWSGLPLRG
jgi:hypothetical protein